MPRYFTVDACHSAMLKNKLSALPWVRWRDPITMHVDLGALSFNLLATSQIYKKLCKSTLKNNGVPRVVR